MSESEGLSRIVKLSALMKPFLAGTFIRISALLGEIAGATNPPPEVADRVRLSGLQSFASLKEECVILALPASVATTEKILKILRMDKPDWAALPALVSELLGRLGDETSAREYFTLTLEEAEHYKSP